MPYLRAFFLWLVLSLPGVASDTRLDFDAAQTTVEFTLADVLHTVHGNFKLKEGSLRFDPARSTVDGQVLLEAATGRSGNDTRDRRMHREILESTRFPEVAFSPSRFTGELHAEQDSQLTVHGTFRPHGADHDVDIPVKVHPTRGIRDRRPVSASLRGVGVKESAHISAARGRDRNDQNSCAGAHHGRTVSGRHAQILAGKSRA